MNLTQKFTDIEPQFSLVLAELFTTHSGHNYVFILISMAVDSLFRNILV